MRTKQKWLAGFCLVGLLITGSVWGNTALQVTHYQIKQENLPSSFNHFRIVQLSDLHNAEFGQANRDLVTQVREQKPDMIALTGDLMDAYHPDIAVIRRLLPQLVKIAPCYYVTGNHEAALRSRYTELVQLLKSHGVKLVANQSQVISKGDEQILVTGRHDPRFSQSMPKVEKRKASLIILLAHRPERFDEYVAEEANLVLSGHAHGGQVRIPFLGGLIAPNQGLLPQYDSGLFHKQETTMIVSRGLGNSIVPLRVNNRPEIVVVDLLNANIE
ncbi:metallophosphoesterase [Vaginisenegalia massiliensis]|uniref:metallophosphoesterase n=1 Tax=Vaginisenegalia massiliensis TaxID=2058294 RepID=UPI000F537A1D|nr:metallophosphoesterase [Vaginisenegalia massiliensis]